MNDTIDVKLPISGKIAVIRNYTTRLDDERASEILAEGVSQQADSKTFSYPVINWLNHTKFWVEALTISIGGDSNKINELLGQQRSEDYAAIKSKVDEIVEQHSPKLNGVSKASETTEKKS